MRERQLNKHRCVPAPSGEQIKNLLFALDVSPRAFGYALDLPDYMVDRCIDGSQILDEENSKKFWKLYNSLHVQQSLPGFVRTVVVPPPHSKRLEENIGE